MRHVSFRARYFECDRNTDSVDKLEPLIPAMKVLQARFVMMTLN
jgi:hypothetical protein